MRDCIIGSSPFKYCLSNVQKRVQGIILRNETFYQINLYPATGLGIDQEERFKSKNHTCDRQAKAVKQE